METTQQASFIDLVLSGISLQQCLVYFFFGMIGIIFSMLIEVYRKSSKHKLNNKEFSFSTGYYVQDNFIRFILSIFVVMAGILFTEDLLQMKINNFVALLAGFNTDKIIESFKSKININK